MGIKLIPSITRWSVNILKNISLFIVLFLDDKLLNSVKKIWSL